LLPYALTRTWHTQLAVLWIAVAWLATGLYIAPAISGREPKYQRLGVNFCLCAWSSSSSVRSPGSGSR
jgi:nitric oxide reductase subunit B